MSPRAGAANLTGCGGQPGGTQSRGAAGALPHASPARGSELSDFELQTRAALRPSRCDLALSVRSRVLGLFSARIGIFHAEKQKPRREQGFGAAVGLFVRCRCGGGVEWRLPHAPSTSPVSGPTEAA